MNTSDAIAARPPVVPEPAAAPPLAGAKDQSRPTMLLLLMVIALYALPVVKMVRPVDEMT